MWNWNYIIFFILLVPRGPALVNTEELDWDFAVNPQISSRSACTPFEQNQLVNGQLKKVMMLNCIQNGQPVVVPMPSGDDETTGGQSPVDPNSKRSNVDKINLINNLGVNLTVNNSG